MRILLVNKYFYRKGGAETYFFALAEGLKALGHEVAFFSMRHPNNEPSYWSKYFVSEKDYVGKISAFQQAKEAATLVYSFESKRQFEALLEEFKYANVMQIPGLTKIVVNMGVGDAARDAKLIEGAIRDLTQITGQKPQVTKARKSIAQFKLREGMPIGTHVTLRGDRMWEFLDRLLSLALPRIRDFRGLNPKQFDGNGNYTFGLTEQSMFHEIDQDKIDRVRGMDITVVTTATNDDEGRSLLRRLGFPFKED